MADIRAFRDAVTSWAAGSPGGLASELAIRLRVRTAVQLEGPSDLAAKYGVRVRLTAASCVRNR
ncbi:hypothetical protein [Streptomyces sp. NPDC002346]